jgi:repressor LexA
MKNARILDGDIVFIRQQPDVENGQIAAVSINDDATLKRVYKYKDHIALHAENPEYPPIIVDCNDMNNIRILGKAIAFQSTVK